MSATATANAPSVLVVIMVGVQEVGLPPSLEYHAILLSYELADTMSTPPLLSRFAAAKEYTPEAALVMTLAGAQATGLPPRFSNHTTPWL